MGGLRGGAFDEAKYSQPALQYYVLIEGGVRQLSFANVASHSKFGGPELGMFPYRISPI